MYQNENIRCKHFDELNIPQNMVDKQKEYARMVSRIHSVDYIWDNMIFSHLVTDIQYFCSIHLITDEDKNLLKEELFVLIDEMEALAAEGKAKQATTSESIFRISTSKRPIVIWRQVPRNSA